MTNPPNEGKLTAPHADPLDQAGDGLRLLKAFLHISDPNERTLVIDFAERLAYKKSLRTN
jgi:hypothetical protein